MKDRDFHAPVLPEQVISFLVTDRSGIYVDGTVGGGGHTEVICRHLSAEGRVIGFDQDEHALEFAGSRLSVFGDKVVLVRSNFGTMVEQLRSLGTARVHGVLLDLGVSSHQLDRAELGFSYRNDGAVDMRMDRRQELTGRDVLNEYPEEDLQRVIREFGEERYARRIARAIVYRRPIESTHQLRDAVGSAVGGRYLTKTLSRVFQAVRIEVNNELAVLEAVLPDIVSLLAEGGRAVVISYHSLEDRIVKTFFRNNRDMLNILTKKPLIASPEETIHNPRSRSAKLRAAERKGPE
ncbi:MAG: 16S rRNA (cytosine(1402)-N(4))-methyltransferase RsmH [Ignavibacteria bacterium]|nr:16S rRNA (cytosine(1402)-N(4))-methyltransferase RsmH [Ignavibacteria bacterium]